MRSLSHRICRPCAQLFDWIVYTDAATTPPRICALRFRGSESTPSLAPQLSSAVPTVWAYRFRSTCPIFGLGLLAMVAFLEDEASELAGCSLWIYMGNNNSLSAMTRGDSNTDAIAVLVARAWELIQRPDIRAWFSRVPPKLNPADGPTRGRVPPFRAERNRGFRSLARIYRKFRGAARRQPPRTTAHGPH